MSESGVQWNPNGFSLNDGQGNSLGITDNGITGGGPAFGGESATSKYNYNYGQDGLSTSWTGDIGPLQATINNGANGQWSMTGQLDVETAINQIAWDGRSTEEHLKGAGLDPTAIGQAYRPKGSLAAYLELHIEQGGTLETDKIDIGVVEGIVGIRRLCPQIRCRRCSRRSCLVSGHVVGPFH